MKKPAKKKAPPPKARAKKAPPPKKAKAAKKLTGFTPVPAPVRVSVKGAGRLVTDPAAWRPAKASPPLPAVPPPPPLIDTHPVWKGPPTFHPGRATPEGLLPWMDPDANRAEEPRPLAKLGEKVRVGEGYAALRGTVVALDARTRTISVRWTKVATPGTVVSEFTWRKWNRLEMDLRRVAK